MILGLIGPFQLLLILLLLMVFMIIPIIAMWKIYEKADQPGWASLIPIYSTIVMLDIAKKPRWWLAMYFVPIAQIVFMIMTIDALVKSFGKSTGFTLGMIFLPYIFLLILAFGDAQYQKEGISSDLDVLDA